MIEPTPNQGPEKSDPNITLDLRGPKPFMTHRNPEPTPPPKEPTAIEKFVAEIQAKADRAEELIRSASTKRLAGNPLTQKEQAILDIVENPDEIK